MDGGQPGTTPECRSDLNDGVEEGGGGGGGRVYELHFGLDILMLLFLFFTSMGTWLDTPELSPTASAHSPHLVLDIG